MQSHKNTDNLIAWWESQESLSFQEQKLQLTQT